MLLSTKLKNQLNKKQNGLDIQLKNIIINGSKRGCSGFIRNIENNIIVYINTEKSCYQPLYKLNLYRYAKDNKDYVGGRNLYATDDNIIDELIKVLNNDNNYNQFLNERYI